MRKFFLTLSAIFCLLVNAMSQRTITGRVTGTDGTPLQGVTIEASDKSATFTAEDGSYSIKVGPGARRLLFTLSEYGSEQASIGSSSVINVTMTSNQKNLQEVVVVGYGTQRRKDVTGSVSTIKGQVVAEKPVQSFDQALAGRAAGVQITIPSGVLNAPPVFRIRGTNSISLGSQPLIIVDGVPVYTGNFSGAYAAGNVLANINPNDIESIDIAKDAASAAIYGSRAANGVVFITTKKGRPGKARLNYDVSVGWTEAIRLPQLLNAQQYTDYKNLAVANANAVRGGSVNFLLNNVSTLPQFKLSTDAQGSTIDTRWYDYVYHKGFSHTNNLSISGGSENTTYYFGAGYTSQQGLIKKNEFKRLNAVLNIDSKIGKMLSVGGKLNFSNERNLAAENSGSIPGSAYSTGGLARNVLVNAPNVSPYNNDGTYNIGASFVGPMSNIVPSNQVGFYNPVVSLDLNRSNTELLHIQSNMYVQLKPVKWLTLRSVYGIDYVDTDEDDFFNPIHGNGQGSTGDAIAAFAKDKRWIWTNTAQIDYTLFQKHNISLLAGNEQQRSTDRGYGIERTTLSDPAYTVVQAGYTTNNTNGMNLTESYLLSSFGRLNYNYGQKYYLSGNIRQDEYSALGVKKGVFWGASAGWEITKEGFWNSTGLDRLFSSFKLRGSYGKVGNVSGISEYAPYSTFSSGLYGGTATLLYNTAGNNQITWETSKKTDVGFSFGLLKDRITGEFAWYKNNIDGLLLSVPQAPSTGLPTNVLQNAGSMYNKGIELTLNATPIAKRDLTWNSSFNVAFNKNEVTALAPGLTEVLFLTGSSTGAVGGTGEVVNRTAPGYSLGYIWVVRSAGIDPATGRRVWLDKNGRAVTYQHITAYVNGVSGPTLPQWTYLDNGATAPAITPAADAVMYQNSVPKVVGGWSNNFRYMGFDLDVLVTYQLGFYVSYGTNAGLHDNRFWNNAADILDYWQKPGDIAKYPKPIYTDNVSAGNTIPSDFNVFKGDFVKLKNVTLGYTLPKNIMSRIGFNTARFYIGGQNLAIKTKYPGPDPEVASNGTQSRGQGSDRNTAPNARVITIGLNVGF